WDASGDRDRIQGRARSTAPQSGGKGAMTDAVVDQSAPTGGDARGNVGLWVRAYAAARAGRNAATAPASPGLFDPAAQPELSPRQLGWGFLIAYGKLNRKLLPRQEALMQRIHDEASERRRTSCVPISSLPR